MCNVGLCVMHCKSFFVKVWDAYLSSNGNLPHNLVIILCGAYSLLIYHTTLKRPVHSQLS